MNIRFFNARILTMEEGRDVFRGELWVKDGRIERVFSENDAPDGAGGPSPRWDKEVDCEDNLLMPGFKDAHTHSGMTFLRSMADDLPLQEWLAGKVFPLEARLTGDDIYYLAKLAVLEYLTSGITSIIDMYLDPAATAQACLDMGMRCVLVSGLNSFTSSVQQMESEYKRWNQKDGLIHYCLGFHAPYTCSRELLAEVADLSWRLHAPVYTHLSETEKEVEDIKRQYGLTPGLFLDSLGLFRYGGGGYHCVYLTEEEKELFRKRGLYVITNPASNLKLASGIAPVAEYDRRGIPVAIGTDGPASNNCLDMFREMFLVTALSKLQEMDASSMDAGRVLYFATVQGAHAMGLWDCDLLSAGKRADLVLIDLKQPNMQPIHNIPKNLVYSGSKANVLMTMIDGKILYWKGDFRVGEDVGRLYAKCQGIVGRLLGDGR